MSVVVPKRVPRCRPRSATTRYSSRARCDRTLGWVDVVNRLGGVAGLLLLGNLSGSGAVVFIVEHELGLLPAINAPEDHDAGDGE